MGTLRTLGFALVVAVGAFVLASILGPALLGVGAALVGAPAAAGASLLRFVPMLAVFAAVYGFARVVMA